MTLKQALNSSISIFCSRVFNLRMPLQMHIKVTDACNQKCSYCSDCHLAAEKSTPSLKKLLDLIDSCALLGTKRVTILGGEPLIRDDIGEIIDRIKKHKISCSLTTNGRLLEKRKYILSKIDQISISIDGDKRVNDAYRGEGSWDAAVKAIKIARLNNTPVQLMSTVTDLSDYRLEYVMDLAERYNCFVDPSFLSPFFDNQGSAVVRREDPGENKCKLLLDHFLNNHNPRMVVSPEVLKYIRNWPFSYGTFRVARNRIPDKFKTIKCWAGRFFASVESNGDLFPCCLPRPDYTPVNVFKLGFREAWKIMPESNCVACCYAGFSMYNAIYSLKKNTLLHLLSLKIRKGYV